VKKIFTVLFLTGVCYAQSGSIDLSFDTDGKVTTAVGSGNNSIYDIALQGDGKIVVVGSAFNGSNDDIVVARYNVSGSIDSSFDFTGVKIIDMNFGHDFARAVKIQTDGKIVIAGEAYNGTDNDFVVIRLNSNGSFDNSFDTDGIVTTDFNTNFDNAFDLALQTDGKIVVAGAAYVDSIYNFGVARYNTNGSLDNTFSTDGKTTVLLTNNDQAYSVAIQSDGKIVLAGPTLQPDFYNAFGVVRLNTDGSLDNSFDTDGKVITSVGAFSDEAHDIAIQTDGKIVVVGNATLTGPIRFAVVRYNTNGTLDNTWNGSGMTTTSFGATWDEARSVVIQPDGKILAGGIATSGTPRYAIALYNSDGTLDNGFDTDGKLTTVTGSSSGINAMAYTSDSKIIAAGYANTTGNFDFAIIRYGAFSVKGIEDEEINNVHIYPNPFEQNITIEYTLSSPKKMTIEMVDANGKIVAVLLANQLQETGTYTQNLMVPTSLPTGNYYMVLTTPEGNKVMKLMKK